MGPFGKVAKAYWDRGLSAIPLMPRSKQPALEKWSGYCNNLPNRVTRADWLERYSSGNIGLCLGTDVSAEFRLGAVDIDDDRYVKVTDVVVGECLSGKQGQKGKTVFVLCEKGRRFKTKQMNHPDKHRAIDFLFSGRMTVVEPSIHPDTLKPYTVCGESILAVDLSLLPRVTETTLDLLRLVVTSEEAASLVEGVSTHDPGLALAAKLVAFGCPDAQIEGIILALVPSNYSGNSDRELEEWIRSARDKGFDLKPSKKKDRKAITDIASDISLSVIYELFHDEGSRSYMNVPFAGGVRHFPAKSSDARLWIGHIYYKETGKVLSKRALDEVISFLEGKARFEGGAVYQRVSGNDQQVAIDLGREDGELVLIDRNGWRLGYDASIKMIRSPGFKSLPSPKAGGDLHGFQRLLNLDERSRTLSLAFMITCLRPQGPYMLLLVEGSHGSGKSLLCAAIKNTIDPNEVTRARLANSERDLMIHAQDYRLPSYDNVSAMKNDLSDALCTLLTGGGFGTRTLFEHNELFVFNYTRPIILNGIHDYANRHDLIDRAIPLRLSTMDPDCRRTESEIWAEYEAMQPGFLGSLYDVVAGAIRNLPTTPAPKNIRMADCVRWLAAAEEAAGLPTGTFASAIIEAQDDLVIERTDIDPVVEKIKEVLQNHRGSFSGNMTSLHFAIGEGAQFNEKYFPRSPDALSKYLIRMKAGM